MKYCLKFCSVLCVTIFLTQNVNGYTSVSVSQRPVVRQKIHPYMVAISRNGSLRNVCAGVLLRENFILTVAQCVKSRSKIRVLKKFRRLVKIRPLTVHIHPNFSKQLDNDIALIELGPRSRFSLKNVKPVFISGSTNLKKERPVVTGFLSRKYLIPTFVKRDMLTLLPQKTCKKSNSFVQKTDMCASMSTNYFTQAAVRQSRKFNLGSPLIMEKREKYILVGIVSDKPWAKHTRYVTFSNVAFYRQWIRDILKNNSQSTERPTNGKPETEELTTEEFLTKDPSTEEITSDEPTTEKPFTENPLTKEPTIETLTTENSVTESPLNGNAQTTQTTTPVGMLTTTVSITEHVPLTTTALTSSITSTSSTIATVSESTTQQAEPPITSESLPDTTNNVDTTLEIVTVTSTTMPSEEATNSTHDSSATASEMVTASSTIMPTVKATDSNDGSTTTTSSMETENETLDTSSSSVDASSNPVDTLNSSKDVETTSTKDEDSVSFIPQVTDFSMSTLQTESSPTVPNTYMHDTGDPKNSTEDYHSIGTPDELDVFASHLLEMDLRSLFPENQKKMKENEKKQISSLFSEIVKRNMKNSRKSHFSLNVKENHKISNETKLETESL